jgi:hypothetical protein
MVAKFDHLSALLGFGTDKLRRKEAIKTAGENPIHGVTWPATEHMAR